MIVIRREHTKWPSAKYEIVTLPHGYAIFKNEVSLEDTSYGEKEINEVFNSIIKKYS